MNTAPNQQAAARSERNQVYKDTLLLHLLGMEIPDELFVEEACSGEDPKTPQQAAAQSNRGKTHSRHHQQNDPKYARDLLALHQGRCSVPADSPIGRAFAGMQVAGEVEMRLSETPGYVDVSVVKKELFAEEPDL